MSNEKGYNGWTNYETWCVHLWLANEQSSHDAWLGHARACWDCSEGSESFTILETARFAMADRLKESISIEDNPLVSQASMYSDLLGAALSEVNWDEIASAFLDEVAEEEST